MEIRTIFLFRVVLWQSATLSLHFSPASVAAEIPYPIELPAKLERKLEVDTLQKERVNPMLLGLNCSWPEKQYGKVNTSSLSEKEVILHRREIHSAIRHHAVHEGNGVCESGHRVGRGDVLPHFLRQG